MEYYAFYTDLRDTCELNRIRTSKLQNSGPLFSYFLISFILLASDFGAILTRLKVKTFFLLLF